MKALDISTVTGVLVKAKRLEKKRDYVAAANILECVWSNFHEHPETSGLTTKLKAELYSLCGIILISIGKSKGLPDYQETAKNLLTESVRIFKKLNKVRRLAQASSHLALSYCYEGREKESLDVIREAEKLFPHDSNDSVYLQLKTNKLIALSRLFLIEESVAVMEEIADRIENSPNLRNKIKFYNQSGFVFTKAERYDLANSMFSKALKLATAASDEDAVSHISNNLAFSLNKTGRSKEAFEHICRAISLATKAKNYGYLISFEDTKANILSNLGDYSSALATINRTLKSLSMRKDSRTHCEALWTKINVQFSIGDRSAALLTFGELAEMTKSELGESEAQSYAEKMLKKLSSLETQSEILPTRIVRFIPKKIHMVNLPPTPHKLFWIPATHSAILGKEENKIVCVIEQKENPVIMLRQETGEFYLGDLTTDEFSGFEVSVLKNGIYEDEIFIPEFDFIEGHIYATAKYNDNQLNFTKFNREKKIND